MLSRFTRVAFVLCHWRNSRLHLNRQHQDHFKHLGLKTFEVADTCPREVLVDAEGTFFAQRVLDLVAVSLAEMKVRSEM
jgi:hypothetical protein